MIDGVKFRKLAVHHDDRGYLSELLRNDAEEFTKFGQVYVVGDLTAGTIRAFHKHERLIDWFTITHGTAKFVLIDAREDSPTNCDIDEYIIGTRSPALLTVPPGVYHGWMALEDDTQLISIASEVYNRENPDETRIPYDQYGKQLWEIKFK